MVQNINLIHTRIYIHIRLKLTLSVDIVLINDIQKVPYNIIMFTYICLTFTMYEVNNNGEKFE